MVREQQWRGIWLVDFGCPTSRPNLVPMIMEHNTTFTFIHCCLLIFHLMPHTNANCLILRGWLLNFFVRIVLFVCVCPMVRCPFLILAFVCVSLIRLHVIHMKNISPNRQSLRFDHGLKHTHTGQQKSVCVIVVNMQIVRWP